MTIGPRHSGYYDSAEVEAKIASGQHRELVGGLWDEIGALQFDFLRGRGLAPQHRLLDIGAGSLRLGRLAAAYLDAGHYFATDLNASLLAVGREHELSPTVRDKLPLGNLHAGEGFAFDFLPAPMDFGIAQSVFTHLPLNHLRRCLVRAAPRFRPGGRLFVTVFLCPAAAPIDQPYAHARGGVVTHDIADPYHCRESDLAWAARDTPWTVHVIGDWNHPRGQQIVEYRRV